MDAFGRQDISDLGFDPNLNKTGNVNPSLPSLGLSSSLIPDVPQSPSTPSPVQQGNVQSQQITGGDLSDIIFSGKSAFTDTSPGYRMGIDPVDHVFKWFIGNTLASIDFGVTNENVLTFNVTGNPATSNAIFIQDDSPSAWPAIDLRRTTGTGSGIYIQNDSPTGYSIDILNASNTPAVHVISSGSGASVVPLQLQVNTAISTNFYEQMELRGGTSPSVSVSIWAANNTTPNGTLTAGKGDICLSSNGKTYVNTDGATAWTDLSASATVDVQTFTSNGTWTKPSGVSSVYVIVTGAGGGGGGGRGNGSSATGTGGAGGGGGNRVFKMFKASDLGATESVTVGTGGTGGTFNTAGTAGGFSSFSTLVAYGGGGGREGQAAGNDNSGGGGGGTGSVGSDGSTAAVTGGVPATTAGANGISGQGGGGTVGTGTNNAEYGGAGGGGTDNATLTAHAGGSSLFSAGAGGAGGNTSNKNGADGGRFGAYTAGGGGAGGAGGASPAAGTAGTNGDSTKSGYGGGGGGGTATAATNGANGGAGGTSGGGGGGGGASFFGVAGTGGNGGRGEVIVISW